MRRLLFNPTTSTFSGDALRVTDLESNPKLPIMLRKSGFAPTGVGGCDDEGTS